MKARTDFVTNSSSSSFVIKVDDLTREQLDILLDFDKLQALILDKYGHLCTDIQEGPFCNGTDTCKCLCDITSWEIGREDDIIYGWTTMDNFRMIEALQELGFKVSDYDDSGSGWAGICWLDSNYGIRVD